VSPFLIPALISNTASGVVAIEFKAKGPNFGVVSACATGTHAIGTAIDFMLRGEADVMLAGGSEAAMTPLCFAGFASMKAMVTSFNDEPKRASRPFDKDRAGFVMGEGAGVVLLETEGTLLVTVLPNLDFLRFKCACAYLKQCAHTLLSRINIIFVQLQTV
jgi:3-oxoacyl-[acyl-carrier-protein] synthase II